MRPHRLDGLTHIPAVTTAARGDASPRLGRVVRVTVATPLRTYVWLDVDDADLPAAQNVFDGLDAGAVQTSFVLAVLQKPAEMLSAIV